jgi:hypothetical protein
MAIDGVWNDFITAANATGATTGAATGAATTSADAGYHPDYDVSERIERYYNHYLTILPPVKAESAESGKGAKSGAGDASDTSDATLNSLIHATNAIKRNRVSTGVYTPLHNLSLSILGVPKPNFMIVVFVMGLIKLIEGNTLSEKLLTLMIPIAVFGSSPNVQYVVRKFLYELGGRLGEDSWVRTLVPVTFSRVFFDDRLQMEEEVWEGFENIYAVEGSDEVSEEREEESGDSDSEEIEL